MLEATALQELFVGGRSELWTITVSKFFFFINLYMQNFKMHSSGISACWAFNAKTTAIGFLSVFFLLPPRQPLNTTRSGEL